MPKLVGVRERRHQPFYDTLIRVLASTAPTPTLTQTTKLFSAGTNLSQSEWTNMTTAGALPSDQTFVILAMRCFLWFRDSQPWGHCCNNLPSRDERDGEVQD